MTDFNDDQWWLKPKSGYPEWVLRVVANPQIIRLCGNSSSSNGTSHFRSVRVYVIDHEIKVVSYPFPGIRVFIDPPDVTEMFLEALVDGVQQNRYSTVKSDKS